MHTVSGCGRTTQQSMLSSRCDLKAMAFCTVTIHCHLSCASKPGLFGACRFLLKAYFGQVHLQYAGPTARMILARQLIQNCCLTWKRCKSHLKSLLSSGWTYCKQGQRTNYTMNLKDTPLTPTTKVRSSISISISGTPALISIAGATPTSA